MNVTQKAKRLATAFAAFACCALVAVALTGCQQEQRKEGRSASAYLPPTLFRRQWKKLNKLTLRMRHSNVSFADTQYKASGELNEMLSAGSYADLLISASRRSMDTAVKEGYVDEGTRVALFKNDLVMVSKEGSGLSDITLEDIAAGKYSICVGDDLVPAGNYAAQSLSTVGVYTPAGDDAGKTGKEISGKGGSYGSDYKVVTDTSVGNVCKHAQSGDVDIAFVYTSDVLSLWWRRDCWHRTWRHPQEHRVSWRYH